MAEAKEIRIGFASFEIGVVGFDLHITIGRCYNATEEELREMEAYVENKIKPLVPFIVTFGNFCYMGENNTIPAYRVYFDDHTNVINNFHRQFYKEAKGKALYPKPKYHITVDTPEKRSCLEAIIREWATIKVVNISFKTRVEGGVVEVTDTTWCCKVCNNINPLDKKHCLTPKCDQWRPIEHIPLLAKAATDNSPKIFKPDWTCPKCQFKVFGSKPQCFKCGTSNPN